MNKLAFTKMHCCGNDFAIIIAVDDATQQAIHSLSAAIISSLADRHKGIGFDQLLLIKKQTSADHDFVYQIFNADGSEAEQCGNGALCVTQLLINTNCIGADQAEIKFLTKAGIIIGSINPDTKIASVDMGTPKISNHQAQQQFAYNNHPIDTLIVSMGNPHVIVITDRSSDYPLITLGEAINQQLAANGANVSLISINSSAEITSQVYERGVGPTLACGSAACAAVAAGQHTGQLSTEVKVNMPGGSCHVSKNPSNQHLILSASPQTVYHAELTLESLGDDIK